MVTEPQTKETPPPAFEWLRYRYDLLIELVSRDIKVRYKGSILGFAWSLLLPIAQLLVFVFLFHRMLAQDHRDYPAYVFCGVLAWNWFSASLLSSAGAITENRDLVRRPGVPLAVLPASRMVTDLVHFVLALPILAAFIIIGGGHLGLSLLALPFAIVIEGMLILALCYLAAAINVTFRDMRHILTVGLMLQFYLTPVFWYVEMAPKAYVPFLKLNPMFPVVHAYRTIFLDGKFPHVTTMILLAGAFGALLFASHRFFLRASVRFAEEV